ncbi:MAG: TonB family protein [Marinifilaceae bacterium]|nr:TonB family protein [Marinifilaceae bacterium]
MFSFVIPSIDIHYVYIGTEVNGIIDQVGDLLFTANSYVNTSLLDEVEVKANINQNLHWYHYFLIVYLLVVFVLVSRFFRNLYSIYVLSKKCRKTKKYGVTLYVLDGDMPTFAFFNKIFISEIDLESDGSWEIITHECGHIKQLHSLDIIVSELLIAITWLNPFVWFYKFSLSEIHEYLADNYVVKKIDNPNHYKIHILNRVAGMQLIDLVSGFGKSSIKKRLLMLGRLKTPKLALVKLIMVLPISVFLLSAFAFTVEHKHDSANVIPSWFKANINKLNFLENYEYPNEVGFSGQSAKGIASLEHKTSMSIKAAYSIADEMPEYVGGVNAMNHFLASNINYDKIDCNKNTRVVVDFTVSENGKVINPIVVKGSNYKMNKEAIRVVKSMPKWTPGKINGIPVRVSYTVPLVFVAKSGAIKPANDSQPIYKKVKEDSPLNGVENYAHRNLMKNKFLSELPRFSGGLQGLRSYIKDNLKYPGFAAEQGYQGVVYIRFFVNEIGEISNARVLKGVNVDLDKEALRVINAMPNWIPGRQNGKNVAVSFTVPIRFAIQ